MTFQQRKTALYNKIRQHQLLVKNFSYLSALQFFNVILQLAIYPYLIRILGAETFGLVIFANSIASYFAIFINFGFDVSATKAIAKNRESKRKLSVIVSSVLTIRFFLFLLSATALSIITFSIPFLRTNWPIYILSLGICIYDTIFPLWYFRGTEKMKFITIIVSVSRIVSTALIFVCIHDKSDFLYVPVLYGVGSLIAGFAALYLIFFKEGIKFYRISLHQNILYIKESFPLFLSSMSMQLYTHINKVLIGSFLTLTEVSYYDLAQRIINVLKIPLSVINHTIYPKVVRENNRNFVRKSRQGIGVLAILMTFLTIILANYIILILGGKEMLNGVRILQILVLSIVAIGFTQHIGNQTMIAQGYHKIYSSIILMMLLFYFISILLLLAFNSINIISITIVSVLVEFFGLSVMLIQCKQKSLF
jgi:O-antigen/teichoic acid export membrane protein